MPVRIGIVGCGMIAGFHARAIAEVRGARLVACASKSPESAQRFAQEFRCRAMATWKELVSAPDVDVVAICTPSGAHAEPAIAAARAGKHVIVEKPLEVTTRRCDRIIQACRNAGVLLATVFPSRFQPCWQPVLQALAAGRLGTLTSAAGYVKWFRTQAYYDKGMWRGTWKLDGGGALMNQAIHTVDLLLWLMGPVHTVVAQQATLAHKRIEVEDTLAASLQFANGAIGAIEATTAAFPGFARRIELRGDRGSVAVEEQTIVTWEFEKQTARDEAILSEHGSQAPQGGAGDPAAIGHLWHARQIADFVDALQRGRAPLIDGAEGRRSVQLIESIYRAARTGKRVTIESPD